MCIRDSNIIVATIYAIRTVVIAERIISASNNILRGVRSNRITTAADIIISCTFPKRVIRPCNRIVKANIFYTVWTPTDIIIKPAIGSWACDGRRRAIKCKAIKPVDIIALRIAGGGEAERHNGGWGEHHEALSKAERFCVLC